MKNEETNEILKQILKWVKLQGIEILRKKIKEEGLFTDKNHILAYYLSDGKNSLRFIEKETGINYQKVKSLWERWLDKGIAETTEQYGGGRCKRKFELDELGLELPKDRKKKENKA